MSARPATEMFVTWRRTALAVGLAGSAVSAIGFFVSREQFFRSYLLGYMLWLGVALGSLGVVMLHNVTGGSWGSVVRRILEAAARTLPVLAILFLPILLGAHHLYEWSHPDAVAHDPHLRHKSLYLNVPFLAARALLYFAVWTGLAMLVSRLSREQDHSADLAITRKLKALSAPGILVYVLTMTFASIDWVMSIDPHWFSTIFGVLFIVGQALSAFAFSITILAALHDREPYAGVVGKGHFHDLGNLLFAFLMLWAYINLSQLIIIWSANLPEEIPWYLRRFRGGWQGVGYLLVLFHFAAPFFLLLQRATKRSPAALVKVAAAIFVIRYVDLFWLIVPEFHRDAFHIHWLDLALPAAIGGIWLWLCFGQLAARPLLVTHDAFLKPDEEDAMEQAHG